MLIGPVAFSTLLPSVLELPLLFVRMAFVVFVLLIKILRIFSRVSYQVADDSVGKMELVT